MHITVTTLLKSVAHEHKNWYGAPVEVWHVYQASRYPDTYIPISNMLCRCAYVTEIVMINEVLETVTIVVNFAGLKIK